MSQAFVGDEWARQMFGDARLGDKRRTDRLVKLAASLANSVGSSPSKASGSPAAQEGAYRFLRNDSVAPDAIAAAGFATTAKAAASVATLLAIEDTTSLSYRHAVADQLGDLGGEADSAAGGYFVHSALLLDAETGRTIGLADQQYWMREPSKRGVRHRRHERAYEDKESFKWQTTSERLRDVLGEQVMMSTVSVCDREADVYEYLHYKLEKSDRFVVRARADRALAVESEDPQKRRLFAAMATARGYGTTTVPVPQRGGRPARTAELTVRASRLPFRRPYYADRKLAPSLEVNVVLACEDHPPAGAEPLMWVLLTAEPIDTHDDVLRVLRTYRFRWRIEEFHKVWKSGTGVEQRRLQSATNIHRLAVILAFVAVYLLRLREIAADSPDVPCQDVLPDLHWKVLWATVEKKPLPPTPPSVQWAQLALARLGGWKDTKRTGRVGWDTIWDGWFKLQERVDGYLAAKLLDDDHRR